MGQDYSNLEIVVADNASTDNTYEIATSYAERDPRIRVVRHERNIGPTANFNFVLGATRGPLFMWAADDDQWDPTFVSSCVAALEANPGAVMASTSVRFVEGDQDEAPADYIPDRFDNPDLSSADPAKRIGRLMSRGGWYQVYGLVRRPILETTRALTPAFGSDLMLTVELAARGPIILIPRPLFTYRVNRSPSDPDRGAWNQDVNGLKNIRATAYTRMQEGCCAALASARLGWWQHQRAHAALLIACYARPTPIRGLIRHEVRTRFGIAVRELDASGILKYGTLAAAVWLRRLIRRARLRRSSG